jgi:tetratricopeptide (TPR) repeat protein
LAWDDDVAADLADSFAANPARGAEVLMEALDRAVAASDLPSARGFGAALGKMGRPEAAEEAAARIAALEQRGGQVRSAAELLHEAEPLVTRAARGGDTASGQRAVELLTRAAALDPGSGEIAWRLGTALITVHDPAAAVGQLRRALGILPPTQQFPVRRDLVVAHYFRRDLAEAMREMDELDRIRPGAPETRYWRTRVLHDQGETARAQAELQQGLRDHPGDPRLEQLRRDLKF